MLLSVVLMKERQLFVAFSLISWFSQEAFSLFGPPLWKKINHDSRSTCQLFLKLASHGDYQSKLNLLIKTEIRLTATKEVSRCSFKPETFATEAFLKKIKKDIFKD